MGIGIETLLVAWRWQQATHEPGKWRVDDSDWHSVSIKYEREKLADDMWGFEAAGTIVRFKIDGAQVDVTVNGKGEKGDCS